MCAYEWTGADLAVLHVAADAEYWRVAQACLARTYVFEQHALGVPIHGRGDALASACCETVALIRGFDRFVADGHVPAEFLPRGARNAVEMAAIAAKTEAPELVTNAQCRLGALVAHCSSRSLCLPSQLALLFPDLPSILHEIRQASPDECVQIAAAWVGCEQPDWCVIPDRAARVARAKAIPIEMIAEVVLATDEPNSKGFSISLPNLHAALANTRARRFIMDNHDRTKPPRFVVFEATISCSGEHGRDARHRLRATIGALTPDAVEALRAGTGFSVAFHHERTP